MDSKMAMRSRMREAIQKRGKRLDSPLVRYNDLGQPVCKVCNVMVKSEALWTAHIASRQHKAAVDEMKSKAAAISGPKPSDPPTVSVESSVLGDRPSSVLPDDFFDTPATKRPNTGSEINSPKLPVAKRIDHSRPNSGPGARNSGQPVNANPSTQTVTQDGKQIPAGKSRLPEGFFDNQDADSRARGLEPVKLDIQDEYKEFQKSIKDDVQGVDVRLEEEEFEAAEKREEFEQIEQRNFLKQIEVFRRRQQEKTEAAAKVKAIQYKFDEIINEGSSDESDEEDNFFIDWRAKHI